MRHLIPALCLVLTSCGAFRAAVRDMRNTDLVGDPAPSLTEGQWVGGEDALPADDWFLVAFLRPT